MRRRQPRNSPNPSNAPYDARADHELSLLLSALDERASETIKSIESEKGTQLRHIADTCAAVLTGKDPIGRSVCAARQARRQPTRLRAH